MGMGFFPSFISFAKSLFFFCTHHFFFFGFGVAGLGHFTLFLLLFANGIRFLHWEYRFGAVLENFEVEDAVKKALEAKEQDKDVEMEMEEAASTVKTGGKQPKS
jgi:hypothetical protein